MKEPKYKIGQEVWLVNSNKVEEEQITTIGITKDEVFVYGFKEEEYPSDLRCYHEEESISPTKEELIASL